MRSSCKTPGAAKTVESERFCKSVHAVGGGAGAPGRCRVLSRAGRALPAFCGFNCCSSLPEWEQGLTWDKPGLDWRLCCLSAAYNGFKVETSPRTHHEIQRSSKHSHTSWSRCFSLAHTCVHGRNTY